MTARLVTVWLLVVALAGAQLLGSEPVSAGPPNADTLAQQVIDLTNAERAVQGLPPLVLQSNLRSSAMWLAQDMADYNYVGHNDRLGRDFVTRIVAFGFTNWTTLGENIVGGFETPADVVNAWMRSTSHQANILNSDFREIGVGVGYSTTATYRYYWVQNFGTRPTSSTPSNNFVPNHRIMLPLTVRG